MPLFLEQQKTTQVQRGLVEVRKTSICGNDVHIIRSDYPVNPGLTIGHEAVDVIHELDLEWHTSQCGGVLGKWRLGHTIDGAGLADQTIVTTLCPRGKERIRRLMRLVEAGCIDPTRSLRFTARWRPEGGGSSSRTVKVKE